MALTNVAAMATDIEIESMPNSIKHDINNATLTVAPQQQQQQQQAQQQQMTAIAIATTTPINTATIANVDVVGKSALPILSPAATTTATATTTKATDLINVPSCNNPPATLALSSATANNGSSNNNNSNGNGNGGLAQGLSMMQSSPPPHSYRHSRAYRHFKNPPQPHMCIRTTTEAGEELFINVLSWTRIVIPQEPSDPIPLYGGMRVPPGSPRSPPIVFAVMANPEVLKDSGRHSKDPEERRAMVELMCDFVEAMNPGVKLVRNAVILKDRDISGELKDVWNAVQAQRDREREEQMLQQRQQQHYHNITTQQMFPKSPDAARAAQAKGDEESLKVNIEPEVMAISNGATSMLATVQQCDNRVLMEHSNNVNFVDAHMSSVEEGRVVQDVNNAMQQNGNESNDQTDAINKHTTATTTPTTATIIATTIKAAAATKPATTTKNSNSAIAQATAAATTTKASATQKKSTIDNPQSTNANHKTSTAAPTTTPTSPTAPTNTNTNANANANTTTSTAAPNVNAITPTPTTTTTATATVAVVAAVTPPTKKEKLGGFLPNGCIFPRFKNNKHKDKDKDKDKEKEKEKETKGKDKEKTLLNALKKSKEKKVAPIEQVEKPTPETDAKTQYEKNCINLENEVQKLDLNKIDASNSNDTNMFIKLKVAATSVAK